MTTIAVLGRGPLHDACMTSLAIHSEVLAVTADEAHWTDEGWRLDDRTHDVLVVPDTNGATRVVGQQGCSLASDLTHGRLYRGVQRAGFPNLFVVGDVVAQAYTQECLDLLRTTGARWLDVRASVQAYADRPGSLSDWPRFARRRNPLARRPRRTVGVPGHPLREDLWLEYDAPGLLDPEWSGPVEIREDRDDNSTSYIVTGRLSGSFQPTDGRYHWQGQLSGLGEVRPGRDVEVRVDSGRWTTCRITEATPWGRRVTGQGEPPFPLAPLEIHTPMG